MAHDCRLCRTRHGDRYLCDPGRALIDAMYARGESYNMPTIELDEPIEAPHTLGDLHKPGGDRLMRQLVVNAALIPTGPGTTHPALAIQRAT